MSAFFFFSKKLGFSGTFTQNNSVRAALESFQFHFKFLKDKGLLLLKMHILQAIRPVSHFWIAANWPYIGKVTITS